MPFRSRLRRIPSPRLPQDRLGRPARPDAAERSSRPRRRPPSDVGHQARRPRASSWCGSPAGRPPSTCGTTSPNAPEGIRGEFKSIDTNVPRHPDRRDLPKMAAVADKVTIVRSLYHTIPSHGPATVFMTTGNKPTPALQYPSHGLAGRQAAARPKRRAALRHLQRTAQRRGGLAGYLGTAYNPFIVEGNGGRQGRQGAAASASAASRCRPASRSKNWRTATSCCKKFDNGFRTVDKNSDLVDGLDTFHKQALEILRSDKTKKAFDLNAEKQAIARTPTAPRRSARGAWRPGGWSRPASASSPFSSAAGTRTARTSTPTRTSCCRRSIRRCPP